MKTNLIKFFKRSSYILLSILIISNLIYSLENDSLNNISQKDKNIDRLIPFSFNNENLSEIINLIASQFKINIILPQGTDMIKQKITFKPESENKVSLKEAWQLMNMFLELSGYALSIQGQFYKIIKKEADKSARHKYPLFIGTDPDDIPNTDQRIQYISFLRNIPVPEKVTKDNPLSQILEQMLSEGSTIIYDTKTNAIILNDKASNIGAAMKIISDFDKSGFSESLDIMHIYYSSAKVISKVLTELSKATQGEDSKSPFISKPIEVESSLTFPSGTKIKFYGHRNMLILMGRQSAINRIKEFVSKYIDIPQKTGKSILHIYELEYLDSAEFGPILSEILKGSAKGKQSEGTSSGAERYFQGPPIVVSESEIESKSSADKDIKFKRFKDVEYSELSDKGSNISESIYRGGNRIIVAALNSDWEVIKSIIQDLDKPEPQVILEVLTISVEINKNKALGATTRRRRNECFCADNNRVEFISSNITNTQNVLCSDSNCSNLNDLASDLIQTSDNSNPNIIKSVLSGSTLITFKDAVSDKIWSIFAILNNLSETKILNHPYLVTTNNKPAQVALSEIRRGSGEAQGTTSGVVTIPFINIDAPNLVQFIPRISSIDRLNLKLKVNLTEFTNTTDVNIFTRFNRLIETSANMSTSQVLAIGGLGRIDNIESIVGTPILSSIPFIGQFFKFTRIEPRHRNLLILISPTIVNPKRRQGLNRYNADKIRNSRKDFDESRFINSKEPINKWFFGANRESDEFIKDYLNEAENAPEFIELLSKKELIQSGLIKEEIKKPQTAIDDPVEKERKLKQVLAYEDNPLLSIKKADGQKVLNS